MDKTIDDQLSDEEIELWRQLDIKGFGGGLNALSLRMQYVLDSIGSITYQGDLEKIEEALTSIDTVCKRYEIGLDPINPDEFDERFPIGTVRYMKEQLLPAIKNLPQETRALLNGEIEKDFFETNFRILFGELCSAGKKINYHPSYQIYRKITELERANADIVGMSKESSPTV